VEAGGSGGGVGGEGLRERARLRVCYVVRGLGLAFGYYAGWGLGSGREKVLLWENYVVG